MTIQYFKMEVFSLPKQSKNLDPSYKMDLDFQDCFGRGKLIFLLNFIRQISIFGSI